MARLVFNAGDVFTIGGSNTVTEVFGSSGKDTITIAAGSKATLFGFDSTDAVSLGGNAGSYTAVRSGSSIVLTDAAGSSVTIPVSTTGQSIAFGDATRTLVYNTTSGNVELGGQAITTTAATVTAGTGGSSTAGQTFTLTTGVDNVSGTAGDDTINAPVTNPTTGADATTIQTLDVINGGAGKDTLNITSTADYNKSLAGLTVSGVEVINITGANNLAVTSSSTAAAVAGAKQVAVYDLVTARPTAEVQTINYGDLTVATAGNITVGGVTVNLAVGDTGKALADKVVAALTADATFNANVASYSVTGGVVTINFKSSVTSATLLDPAATASANGTAVFEAARGVTSAAITATTTVAASLTSAIKVTVNGTEYSANVTTLANQLSTTAATKDAADATVLASTRTAVKDLLTTVLGGTATVGDGDNLNEVRLTSKNVGQSLPSVSVAQGATSISTVDSADPFVVANVEKTGAEGALSQILGITVAGEGAGVFTAAGTFQLVIGGVTYGATAIAAGASNATVATAIAGAINAVLGTGVATASGAVVSVTAPTAGTALPHMNVVITGGVGAGVSIAEIRANQDPLGTATSTTAASISAASYADATEIWLAGASGTASVAGVAATQTVGFSSVSSMTNSVTFGSTVTTGSVAVSGSAGTLTVTGAAMTALNIAGTGSTGLTVVDGSTTDTIKSINLSTTGSTTLTLTEANTGKLTSVTQTGAGGVTLSGFNKIATVTTGAGADLLKINTATEVDNAGTTLDETINASVNSGAGNDRLVIATTGAGKTAVDAGAGNDTIYLTANTSGSSSIAAGDGNDTVIVGAISALQVTKIDGGAGTDTLRTSTTAFTATDYTILSANISGFETLQLSGAVTALDASKVAVSTISLLAQSATVNDITEVSSAQSIVMSRTAPSDAVTGFTSDIPAVSQAIPSALKVASKGYVLDSDLVTGGNQTTFGDNLSVTMTHTSATGTVEAYGNKLTIGITALGDTSSSSTATGANVTGISSKATLSGNLKAVEATLTSARGVGSAAAPAALGEEEFAQLAITLDSDGETSGGTRTLGSLETVKVSGAGVVTIDTRTDLAATAATLKSIDLSGMTAFADLNPLGQEQSIGGVAGGYNNLSKSTVTLDNQVAETVILGGAQDTVVTGSTIAARDTVTGFQLTASAADPLAVDLTRSDVLKIGTNFTTANAAKMVTTAGTLEAALLEASNYSVAGSPVNNVVFHFGGDTYVFQDLAAGGSSVAGLDDGDILVRLSGTLNLDLLIQTGVIIA